MVPGKGLKIIHLALILLIAVGGTTGKQQIRPLQQVIDPPSQSSSTGSKSLYLPIAYRDMPWVPSVFGLETNSLYPERITELRSLNAYWLRRFFIDWSRIEPVRTDPPTYNWSSVDEAGLSAAASAWLTPIVMIKFTPSWAQRYPGVSCGPPAPDRLDEFAQFLQAVVARYSKPPYNVHYWEIGNEVDIDYRALAPNSIFGCWGNADKPYFDGGYYADMLKQAAPAIKSVDPAAQILIGGLLMDCDPTNPPAGKDCKSSTYLQGVLENGGAPYFDIVGYHGYSYYIPGKIWEDTPNWAARGGVFKGKLSYLREVLAKYAVSKPLMQTEVSLICSEGTPGCDPIGDEFKELQADYVYWSYLRGWEENLAGIFWYTLEDSGWKSSGLKAGSTPKPAYYAFQYLSKTLQGATLVGPVTQFSGVTGYEYRLPTRRLWILWSSDQTAKQIKLPATVIAIRDKYGKLLALSTDVSLRSPLIFEFMP